MKLIIIGITVFINILLASSRVLFAQSLLSHTETNWSIGDKDIRIVLAKVIEAQLPKSKDNQQIPAPADVRYRALVFCESQNRIAENHLITIHGQIMVFGSNAANIPLMGRDNFFVMVLAARPAVGNDFFEFAGKALLPIGFKSPCTIDVVEVPSLREALIKLGFIISKCNGVVPREDAKVFLSQDNDYLWCLGAAGLAAQAGQADVDLLSRVFMEDKVTLRRILWLDHCFEEIVPAKFSPNLEQRHELVVEALYQIMREDPNGRTASFWRTLLKLKM